MSYINLRLAFVLHIISHMWLHIKTVIRLRIKPLLSASHDCQVLARELDGARRELKGPVGSKLVQGDSMIQMRPS